MRIGTEPADLTLGFVQGAHGQDLLDGGRAAEVLHASGRVLARIHSLDVTAILPGSRAGAGEVLVHGDYGPNNLLFDPDGSGVAGVLEVAAVLDWEWAHVGQRIEDLAWCEWIVWMHHPEQVGAMDDFFAGYVSGVPGRNCARPAWVDRQSAMVTQCQRLIDFCERWEPGGDGVREWQTRAARTADWVE